MHPTRSHTLTSRSDLADWRGKAEHPVRAVATLAMLLNDMERVLGSGHPYLVRATHSLARWDQPTAHN
jgi:hypothetical protein